MIDGIGGGGASSAASTATGTLTAGAGDQMGKNEFLKLLIAQLRHQDPLNPMQGQDLAVQLAQFSSVEQLMDLNKTLKAQADFQTGMLDSLDANAAWGAIGRTVVARGNVLELVEGAARPVTAEIGGLGGAATLRLLDASGKEVGSRSLGFLAGGRHTLELGSAADGLGDGVYTVRLDVVDGAGDAIPSTLYTTARVDGLRYTPEGTMLTAGGLDIPYGAVVQVLAGEPTAG